MLQRVRRVGRVAGRRKMRGLSLGILASVGCGSAVEVHNSNGSGSTQSAESTSSGTSSESTAAEATGTESDLGTTVGSSGATGSSGISGEASTSTGPGEPLCDATCGPPDFELAWRVELADIASTVTGDVSVLRASVLLSGESWIYSRPGDPKAGNDDSLIVVSPDGDLVSEWTPSDLGVAADSIVAFAAGEDGFAVATSIGDPDFPTQEIRWYTRSGEFLCAAPAGPSVLQIWAQRDGSWLMAHRGFVEPVRFDSVCGKASTYRQPIPYPDAHAPGVDVLGWTEDTLVYAGTNFGLGQEFWHIEVYKNGLRVEDWYGPEEATLAAIAYDGRVIGGGSSPDGPLVVVGDPVRQLRRAWNLGEVGFPAALMSDASGTWVVTNAPRTVVSIEGEDCCSTTLDSAGETWVLAGGRLGEDVFVVESPSILSGPVFVSRHDAAPGGQQQITSRNGGSEGTSTRTAVRHRNARHARRSSLGRHRDNATASFLPIPP